MTAEEFNPDDDMLRKMGARLRELRIARGYSNYETFANKFGLNRVQYGRYEKGENLKFLSLLKVIRLLGVTLQEFFSEGFDQE